jgi:hypothetical protein
MSSRTINGHLNADDIKRSAAGRCSHILQTVCGLTEHQLNPKVHGPCPDCGGTDRFRAFDDVNASGGLLCNQCGKRSDVFASIQWLRNCTFLEALKLVADEIGHNSNGHHNPASQPTKLKKVHDTAEQAADALAWGMVKSGIMPEQRKPDMGWRYRNADGSDAGAVLRWDLPNERKEIRQVACVPDGWITSAMPEPRPLYRLPDIIDATEIWICEGEKAADAAALLGLQATTSAGGSNAAEKSDWTPLDGKTVYIVPDNDQAGEKYAGEVVELIRKQAPNATVRVNRLKEDWPAIPDGGDIFDWQEQFDTASAEMLRARLDALPDRTGEYATQDVEASQAESSRRIDFEIIDSTEFAATDYRTDFLIVGVMTEGQSQLIGGPSKTLKTSILVDQCLSLAAGDPFIGKYAVPKPKRVLLLSSESGTATLQETARRICKAKGIDLAELGDQLHWGFRPPQLTDAQHIATLTDFVLKNRIDVVAIDPAYLSMNLQGNEAANQFAVGAVLMNLTNLQADTGATPILATHFRMHMLPGVMPSLEHIAGAGFGQWARQWLLLNRREPFSDENPGEHKLLMTYGGSAGHCGGVALDVQEGKIQEGRVWRIEVSKLSEIREQRNTERHAKKRDQESRTYENHRATILRTLKRFPDGESMSTVRDLTGISGRYFRPVWEDLLTSQEIEPCDFTKGKPRKDGTPKMYPGCKIVDPKSRLSVKDSDTSDTLGHTRTLSDTVQPA